MSGVTLAVRYGKRQTCVLPLLVPRQGMPLQHCWSAAWVLQTSPYGTQTGVPAGCWKQKRWADSLQNMKSCSVHL